MSKPVVILVNYLPFNISGLSCYPFIIIQKDRYTFGLLKHEYIHYLQAKRAGPVVFFIRYLLLLLLVGYKLNPFELEAAGKIKPHKLIKK